MQPRDFLVEFFRQGEDFGGIFFGGQFNLGKALIGEQTAQEAGERIQAQVEELLE